VVETIQKNRAKGRRTVLGLITGNFVAGVYREWVRLHREEGVNFSSVETFNLGEFLPITPDSLQSHHRFLHENLFDHVNIPEERIHLLRGDIPRSRVSRYCKEYEEEIQRAGGIDIQLLEAGGDGHIGFNDAGTRASSRTRLVSLNEAFRKEAAADFFSEENVPEFAVTMGLGTVLEAREICLIAIGEGESVLVQKTLEGEVTPNVPTSFLQGHPNATVFLDTEATDELARVKKPWLLGEVEWTPALRYRAVIQLSEETGTALPKLQTSDYTNHHLAGLLRAAGPTDALNSWVAKALTSRIWHKADFFEKKRVLIFSPHPDDDVICMGGTMQKLVARKNRVDVAFMTNGNLAVFDEDAIRHLEFIERIRGALGSRDARDTAALNELMEFLRSKRTGQMDSPGVRNIKRIIRESEAVAAIETLGIPRERAHFLDLPFYHTGTVKKDPIGEADVQMVLRLLRELKPDVLYVAGDMTDPHGTHRMCKQAIDEALAQSKGKTPEIWLYRGAWQEWDIPDVDVFVPLSKPQARKKTLAIFKHESQKDRAVFPGPSDDREFWQRAEDRNRGTAEALDRLGLQEYYSIEAFVRAGKG
jgi:glucosamine-6-phosphate deaminase